MMRGADAGVKILSDNTVAFSGGNFYLAIQATTFADIKKVTVEMINP